MNIIDNNNLFAFTEVTENSFFEQDKFSHNAMYNISSYTKTQAIDIGILQQAWDLIYENLKILGLRVAYETNGESIEYISRSTQPKPISFHDLSKDESPEVSAKKWMINQVNTPMDFISGDMYQLTLLYVAPGQSYFFTRLHNIIIDTIGSSQLHEFVLKTYCCLVSAGSTAWLSNLPQYSHYPSSQYLSSSHYEQDKDYWRGFLIAQQECHRLTPRYLIDGYADSQLKLSNSLTNELRTFCAEKSVSMLALISSAVSMTMVIITRKNELLFNLSDYGRFNELAGQVMHEYSYAFPIFCPVIANVSLINHLNKMSVVIDEGYSHRFFPEASLIQLADEVGGILPDIQFSYDTYKEDKAFDQLRYTTVEGNTPKLPLRVRMVDYGLSEGITLKADYSLSYFSQKECQTLLKRIQQFFTTLIECPTTDMRELTLLFNDEQDVFLNTGDSTGISS